MKIGKYKIGRVWTIVIVIILLLLAYILIGQILKNPLEGYTTEKVSAGDVVQEVTETGSVRATKDINLSFKSIGRVASINAVVGDMVKKGDTLAVLDSSGTSAQMQSAVAQLNTAKTQYEKLLKGSTPEEIQTYKNSVSSAENNLQSTYKNALNVLDDSYTKIYNAYNVVTSLQDAYFYTMDPQGIKVSQAATDMESNMKSVKNYLDAAKSDGSGDVDTAISKTILSLNSVYDDLRIIRDQCDQGIYYTTVAAADKASLDGQKTYINSSATSITTLQQNISSYRIALQSAKDTLAVATAEPRQEDIEIYKSQIDQAQANVNLYQSQIGDNSIISPIDGRITAVNAKRGEVVSYSAPIIQMLSSEPFQIKVNIYEQDIVNVDPGDVVKINLVAFPDQTFEGKVLSVDPAEKIVDNVVYYETTIEFPNQPVGIRSGMTADVTVEAAKKQNVMRISRGIVEEIDGKKMVDVVVGKKIEKREIETGFEGNDYYEVISGLSEGDQVVVSAP